MAKDDRLEIQWVTFAAPVRLSSQSSATSAMARSEVTRLYLGSIAGLPFVVIEDPSLPFPSTIPLANVASMGWVTPPTISGMDPKTQVLK